MRRHALAEVRLTAQPLAAFLREPDKQNLIVLASHVALNESPGEEPQRVSGIFQKILEVVLGLVDGGGRGSGKTGRRGAAGDQLTVGVERNSDVSVGIR